MTGVNVTYTTNIPFSSNNPSSDQPIMEQNTNSINSVMSVDHSAFNTSDSTGGYHAIIHQPVTLQAITRSWNAVTRVFNPAVTNTSGLNQIIAANYTPDTLGGVADTQLFGLTGAGGVSQLTGNSVGTDGWCWLGGILIQWGLVNGTHGSAPKNFNGGDTGAITFKNRVSGAIPFPSACFSVWTQFNYNSSAPSSTSGVGNVTIDTTTITNTGFTWTAITNSAKYTQFFWIAIGN